MIRILIADDEVAQMRALCDTLSSQGYETVGCSSGEAALQALRADSYQVLLADLIMPGLDGIGLVQAARALDPDLACIIMTGEGTITSAVQSMQVGALDYILKPFRVSVILQVLARALETRKLRLQNAVLESRLREHAVQLVRMNDELRTAQQQTVKASQAKSDFLSHMSHELRTPLNAILGFTQILLSEKLASTPAQKKQYTNNILLGARHLLKLTNEILDLAKIESGSLTLDMEALNVAQVLQECRTLVDPQVHLRGITVQANVAEQVCVLADRMRLKQVLINLLSNAVKYNREYGTITIECSAEADAEGRLRIAVQDTGNGLSAEQQGDLFQPFNRLGQESGSQEGSGLGLVLSKHLVERMGGQMGVASKVGLGSTFWLVLPAWPAPVAEGGQGAGQATGQPDSAAVPPLAAVSVSHIASSSDASQTAMPAPVPGA